MGCADDGTEAVDASASGLVLALASSASFALSGVLARAMIDSGWSAGAIVTVRIAVGAAVLLVPGVLALRGAWASLRRSGPVVVIYGLIAVAACQLAYFYSVSYLQAGVALLIEFSSPLAVLVWMWLRHQQRPGRLTVLGAALAIAGLDRPRRTAVGDSTRRWWAHSARRGRRPGR
jgi:drug/metabolite transporter (DMT)-like permease